MLFKTTAAASGVDRRYQAHGADPINPVGRDAADADVAAVLKPYRNEDFMHGARHAGGDGADAAGPWRLTHHTRFRDAGRFLNPAVDVRPSRLTVSAAYSRVVGVSDRAALADAMPWFFPGTAGRAPPAAAAPADPAAAMALDRRCADGSARWMPAHDLFAAPERPVAQDAAAGRFRQGDAPAAKPDVPLGELRGTIDVLRRDRIEGWAQDLARPDEPVQLTILVDDMEIATLPAEIYRPDLAEAGIGTGRHAFLLGLPWLSAAVRHVVAVRRAADGRDLHRSPIAIEPAVGFDHGLEEGVTAAVDGLEAGAEEDRVLAFLMTQTDKLQQRRARILGPSARRAQLRVVPRSRLAARATPLTGTATVLAARPHALVIANAVPGPDWDAGSDMILEHMRALQDQAYAVSFVAAQGTTPVAAAEALEAMGVACCRAPFYVSVEEVVKRWAGCIDVVYMYRLSNFGSYLALTRQHLPKARILFSPADHAEAPQAAMPLKGWTAARQDGPVSGGGIRWSEIGAARPASAGPARARRTHHDEPRPEAGETQPAAEFAAD